MDPLDRCQEHEKKIKNLELDLNDLRQGLATVTDFFQDLEHVSRQQDAVEAVDQSIVKPLIEEDIEFEGIWRFHEEVLVADPVARVACTEMYEAFIRYCKRTGRSVVDEDAFGFVFSRMENPGPVLDCGEWTGYRLRTDGG
jgi:hypothetical protein